SKNIDASVLNRIPSNDVIGVMAANVDPQSIKAFIEATGFDGILNSLLAKKDLSLDDVFAATNGQFLVAFSDLTMKKSSVTIPGGTPDSTVNSFDQSTRPDYSVLFATSVNKKAAFD